MKGLALVLGLVGLGAIGLTQYGDPSRTAVVVDPKSAGVGRVASGLTATDIQGKTVSAPVKGAKATVILLTSTTCPLCLKYGPTLAGLERTYDSKGVSFIYVNPSDIETVQEIRAQVKKLGLKGPMIHDKNQAWTDRLDSVTTTEAYLLDSKGRLVYRGAVDDQYSIGATLPKPRNTYLADAISAVLAGRTPKVQATKAPGCVLAEVFASNQKVPTFHEKVQPIIQNRCLSCHREGGAAPFSLATYDEVRSHAKMMQFVVEEGIMPPWFAAKGTGPWRSDMSLSDSEKAALKDWISGGMPKGDARKAPTPPQFADSWTIGRPDAVFQFPQAVKVRESGVMPYININVPTNFTEDKWVEKIEVLPGDRRAVHHVLVFLKTPSEAGSGRNTDLTDELSGFFGAYVPGNSSLAYQPGMAKRIPKGSVLRFQMHYTPFGEATEDVTKIGLVFAKQPPVNEVHTASLANLTFSIPPGADSHEVMARLRIPREVKVLSFLPHMHVRGKAARYELTKNGATKTLLDVPRYDFNWQLNYVYQTPLTLDQGDILTYRAWYDNSDKNPANPDPTRRVGWGLQTFDEMHLGYVEYIVPGEKPGEGSSILRRRGLNVGTNIEQIFARLDRDKDGFVTQREASFLWENVKEADENGDGKLSLAEVRSFYGLP